MRSPFSAWNGASAQPFAPMPKRLDQQRVGQHLRLLLARQPHGAEEARHLVARLGDDHEPDLRLERFAELGAHGLDDLRLGVRLIDHRDDLGAP
jgi:hypothetical protein